MKSLFDIQINGFAGVDFQQDALEATDLRRAVDALAEHQTRRFFLTLITDRISALRGRLIHLENLRAEDPVVAAAVCGYHLEGPWLSPEAGYRGAHNPELKGNPEYEAFQSLQDAAGGNIRLLTLAPELPGSMNFIRQVLGQGTEVSIGHSNADEATIDAAVRAGVRFCTHLGNGVPTELHRHDNVVQRLLSRDELHAFFVPDGIHLPPNVLKNMQRAKPWDRFWFTTDAMAAAGAPPGRYRLGAHELEVGEDRVVRMPGSPQFAGSALEPDRAAELAARFTGIPLRVARSRMSEELAKLFEIELPELDSQKNFERTPKNHAKRTNN